MVMNGTWSQADPKTAFAVLEYLEKEKIDLKKVTPAKATEVGLGDSFFLSSDVFLPSQLFEWFAHVKDNEHPVGATLWQKNYNKARSPSKYKSGRITAIKTWISNLWQSIPMTLMEEKSKRLSDKRFAVIVDSEKRLRKYRTENTGFVPNII